MQGNASWREKRACLRGVGQQQPTSCSDLFQTSLQPASPSRHTGPQALSPPTPVGGLHRQAPRLRAVGGGALEETRPTGHWGDHHLTCPGSTSKGHMRFWKTRLLFRNYVFPPGSNSGQERHRERKHSR